MTSVSTTPSAASMDNTVASISGDMSLNDIAAKMPAALQVFANYGLDSCCGGAKRLDLVCEKHQLAIDDVLRDLRALA